MKKIVALGVVVVVLIAGTVWAYRRHRVDPQVQKILQMQQKLDDKDLTEEQRRAMWEQVRVARRNLSESQRQQMRDQGFARGQRRMTEMAAAYCNMTPDQKSAYMSQFVADMQKRQQEWEARRAADQAQNGGSAQNGSGQGGNGRGGAGGPGGGANRFNQQARNQRRLQMLDNTTPEQRAQMNVFRQGVQQQCAQQGITPPRFMGGGR